MEDTPTIAERQWTMAVDRLNRLACVVVIVLSSCHFASCGWMLSSERKIAKQSSRFDISQLGTRGGDDALGAASEVVGAGGRIGSQFLRQDGAVAVLRGVSPGCFSPRDSPIYVATPSKCWRDVYRETLKERRHDLVWVGNGLVIDNFINTTVVVPHYGILSVGAKPTTSTLSPPTYIYGKHSDEAKKVLENDGVKTELVTSWEQIQTRAAQKLLWASCMWLLCHSSDQPLTVKEVHEQNQSVLTNLVTELLPAVENAVGRNIALDGTLAYLESYSLSMPNAIPSKELAMDEVCERNGVWLQQSESSPQPLHEALLLRIGGAELFQMLKTELISVQNDRQTIRLREVGLSVLGSKVSDTTCRSAVVVGAGIVGSSVALNLARRRINVTVLDCLDEASVGATTPASWAWINANHKSPEAYQWLNQLGMFCWRRDPVISSLPTWNGALVQFKDIPVLNGGYSVEGPLSVHRVHELEPQANFSYSNGPIYFFLDEGCVDPSTAVQCMRQAARELGVHVKAGQSVTALLRDAKGCVVGVQSQSSPGSANQTDCTVATHADAVVVAAGVGSAAPFLGGLPMTHSPGQIAFARSQGPTARRLKRILVDTVRESHVLQRKDGTIVAGGGFLEVGGKAFSTASRGKLAEEGSSMLTAASLLAPDPVSCAEYSHSATAVRPMPVDGWPVVGTIEPGLYTAVTHSGVTLAPILGPLAAAEIVEGLDLDILRPYRPSRFEEMNDRDLT